MQLCSLGQVSCVSSSEFPQGSWSRVAVATWLLDGLGSGRLLCLHLFFFFFKLYIIVLVFAKYQNESATGIHVSPSWVPSGLTVRAAVISWLDGSNVLCLLIELQYFSSHPCVGLSQERLVLSVLPRFVVLEMINDMTNVEDEHLQHQFHRIYIHRYENVRWATRPPPRSLPWLLSPHHHDFCLPKCQRLSSCDWLTH